MASVDGLLLPAVDSFRKRRLFPSAGFVAVWCRFLRPAGFSFRRKSQSAVSAVFPFAILNLQFCKLLSLKDKKPLRMG